MSNTQNVQCKMYSLGLIGYPLGHSLSPQIHGAALHALGISGEYILYPIPPLPEGEYELAALLARVKDRNIHGLNVTIPHKQNVIPLLDKLTPAAATIGAVNTIFFQDGTLIGDNTDAPGFWGDLQRIGIRSQSLAVSSQQTADSALVLGAGGSARAAVYALLIHGYQVVIAARRIEQARGLCDQFSVIGDQYSAASGLFECAQDRPMSAVELTPASISNLKSPISLLVNTTPVGMHPHEDTSPWPAGIPLPKHAAVYDLVYNPSETLLVKQACSAGLPAATGLGMLVEQAALAFERWTGVEAPRDEMLAAINFKPGIREAKDFLP